MLVRLVKIDTNRVGQRVDNFLMRYYKGVPRTRIYRALRTGEVRVNRKRIKPDYRLAIADEIRLPALRVGEASNSKATPKQILQQIENAILIETECYLAVDKPSGIAVHGGTGIHSGLIEALRELRPDCKLLELVHRIDKETSGCLLIAKKRSILVKLHSALLAKKVKKRYVALLLGEWEKDRVITVKTPLRKNTLASGERIVVVDNVSGKSAETVFRPVAHYPGATLVEATLITGRTHQIRVHAASIGRPIAGDRKYGDKDFNKFMKKRALSRLFLHASTLACRLEDSNLSAINVEAPLPSDLLLCLEQLSNAS